MILVHTGCLMLRKTASGDGRGIDALLVFCLRTSRFRGRPFFPISILTLFTLVHRAGRVALVPIIRARALCLLQTSVRFHAQCGSAHAAQVLAPW